MSKNLSILLIVLFFSVFASLLTYGLDSWTNFFKSLVVFYIFFCGMVAPAFEVNVKKKKNNKYGME